MDFPHVVVARFYEHIEPIDRVADVRPSKARGASFRSGKMRESLFVMASRVRILAKSGCREIDRRFGLPRAFGADRIRLLAALSHHLHGFDLHERRPEHLRVCRRSVR